MKGVIERPCNRRITAEVGVHLDCTKVSVGLLTAKASYLRMG